MNVLLVGEESAGAQTLKLLLNSPHHLVGVLASSSRKAVGGMTVWQHAEKTGCRLWPAESVKDPAFADVVRDEQVDLLLNVHSLFVIKPEIVEAPSFGSFNLHPGPLPRYAGLNAPSWAIYKGENTHGVTLHRMLAGIDNGPIAYQALFNVEEKDTGFSVSAKCIRYGMDLIRSLLEDAAEDPHMIPVIEQDFTKREYFGKGTPENGWLAWSRPAREIFNFVRAADYSPFKSPWQTPRAKLGDREVAFVKVSLTGQPSTAMPGIIDRRGDGQVYIASSDEWIHVNRILIDGQLTDPAHVLTSGERLDWEA
ncbi:MAG: hypothetical protein IPM55_03075 [Acidobacteria bacterium]|nr:hypothetical protein [Acidobacteriota bacterium]